MADETYTARHTGDNVWVIEDLRDPVRHAGSGRVIPNRGRTVEVVIGKNAEGVAQTAARLLAEECGR